MQPWVEMSFDVQMEVLGRVLLAAVLGGVIGLEREQRHKPAGLRTQMVVAATSCLVVNLSFFMIAEIGPGSMPGMVRSDPTRIVQAIFTGVSFIGAGTIIQRRGSERLEGLTTAATILMTSSIGIAVALGQHALALSLSLATVALLLGLGKIESRIRG